MPKIGDTIKRTAIMPGYIYYLIKQIYSDDNISNYMPLGIKDYWNNGVGVNLKFSKYPVYRSSFSDWNRKLYTKSSNLE